MLARSALKVGVKVATAGALASTDFEDLADAVSSEVEDLTDKHIGELLTKHAERHDAIRAFREALQALPALLSPPSSGGDPEGAGAPKPLIFIIDELDRCKPSFALEILERIKHFFSAQNVHFVLGVHMGQLRASVSMAYGTKVNASAYLQKFISLTFPLADRLGDRSEEVVSKYISFLTNDIDVTPDDHDFYQSAAHFTRIFALLHGSTLRDIEHFLTNIALATAFTTQRTLRPAPLIAGLSILRVAHPELYIRAKRGLIQYDDVTNVFGFHHEGGDDDRVRGYSDWERGWWQYASQKDADKELVQAYDRSLFNYSIGSRLEIIPMIASKVIDKLIDG